MLQIIDIDDKPKQRFIQAFNDIEFTFDIEFNLNIQRWFASINWQDKLIFNNFKILQSTLLLRQYKNILPFDIICFTSDNQPPYTLESFTIGNAIGEKYGIFVVNQEEANTIETSLFNALNANI